MSTPAIAPDDAWQRIYWQAGGGDAFLFYVVHGPLPADFAVSRNQYRCTGLPAGVELMAFSQDAHPEIVDGFREGHLWKQLQQEQPALAAAVAAQGSCIVLRGSVADPEDLGYFRDAIGIVTWLLDQGGVAVYDPLMFRWWSPADWRASVFEPAAPRPRQHVLILVSEDDEGTEWLHTRGLRKFGRPDLSIHRVPANLRTGVVELFERFIEFEAFGGLVDPEELIRMEVLPAGMRCEHRGSLEDPDFNNVHVEILWPDDDA